MNHADLQKLAEAKAQDAQILFQNERWSNAYYLAGYAVEFAIKACAAKRFVAEAIPDRKLVESLHTHDFEKLISAAGLRGDRKDRQDADAVFARNWGIVAEWSPESRYSPIDKSSAHYLLHAIADPDHGVLAWIKTHW